MSCFENTGTLFKHSLFSLQYNKNLFLCYDLPSDSYYIRSKHHSPNAINHRVHRSISRKRSCTKLEQCNYLSPPPHHHCLQPTAPRPHHRLTRHNFAKRQNIMCSTWHRKASSSRKNSAATSTSFASASPNSRKCSICPNDK